MVISFKKKVQLEGDFKNFTTLIQGRSNWNHLEGGIQVWPTKRSEEHMFIWDSLSVLSIEPRIVNKI